MRRIFCHTRHWPVFGRGKILLGSTFGDYFRIQDTGQHYRFSYINSMVKQRIGFFDKPTNSSGSLASRLATDPDGIKSLAEPKLGVMIVLG